MKRYLLVIGMLALAACGSGEEADTTAVTVVPAVSETTVHDDSMTDDSMVDEEMTDDSMADEEMTDDSSQG